MGGDRELHREARSLAGSACQAAGRVLRRPWWPGWSAVPPAGGRVRCDRPRRYLLVAHRLPPGLPVHQRVVRRLGRLFGW